MILLQKQKQINICPFFFNLKSVLPGLLVFDAEGLLFVMWLKDDNKTSIVL